MVERKRKQSSALCESTNERLTKMSSNEKVKNMPESNALALLANWDGILPVDPVAIANDCGLEVREEPELKELQLSGYLDVPNHVILVNPFELYARQRFTIAHELGRYLFGHGSANGESERANVAMLEVQANQFAVELLMPVSSIRQNLRLSTTDLCERFGVSARALEYRLKHLGVI